MHRVQKYLKPFYIGDVSNEEIETIDEDQAIKDDFAQLRQKAVAKVSERKMHDKHVRKYEFV